MLIHFICNGNVFRSLMAEAYLNSLQLPNITAISSGTMAEKHANSNKPNLIFTLNFLLQKDIAKYAKNHWDQLTQDRINDSSINICMNKKVLSILSKNFTLPDNSLIWAIDDRGEVKNEPTDESELLIFYEKTFSKLVYDINKLVNTINKTSKW